MNGSSPLLSPSRHDLDCADTVPESTCDLAQAQAGPAGFLGQGLSLRVLFHLLILLFLLILLVSLLFFCLLCTSITPVNPVDIPEQRCSGQAASVWHYA